MLLILFMYIFSFPLFKNINQTGSNFVIGILLVLYFMCSKKYRIIVLKTLKKKYVVRIFIFLTTLTLYSLTIPTFLETYDYSIMVSFISHYAIIIIGIFIFSFYEFKNKITNIPYDLVKVFVIQGVIQVISFSFPNVNIFLNNFRTESAINLGQIGFYEGTRGLALSGQAFFGLGVGFGLVFILFFKAWYVISPKYPYLKFLYLIILIFGAISAARMSLVGLVIGIIYFFVEKIEKIKHIYLSKNKISSSLLGILFSIPIFSLVITIVYQYIKNNKSILEIWNSFTNYAFELFEGFFESGNLSTTSTDILFNKMYFPIKDSWTFLIGDGIYTNIDGSYYMHTDAGYMRNILFFGIVGLILLFLYQMTFLIFTNKENILLNFSILIYILIIHIKGEALGFSTMLQSMLLVNMLYYKNKCTISNVESYHKNGERIT